MLTRREMVGALAAPAFLRGAARRPNILYIMTDDHGWSEMGCAGNPIVRTPNLDRLAAEGVRFSNCFCTNSLCAPSRATCLTGTYSHINGVMGNSEAKDAPPEYMRREIPTYPELLKRAGYKTAMIGKWHLSDEPRGFDFYNILPGQGVYMDPEVYREREAEKAKRLCLGPDHRRRASVSRWRRCGSVAARVPTQRSTPPIYSGPAPRPAVRRYPASSSGNLRR